jgi:chromosome condensin MukBEF ATPase and DNA-binding subunit MukB
MSDTPLTDAQLTSFLSISKLGRHFTNRTGTVSAKFARKLERSIYECEKEIKDLTIRAQKAERDYDLINSYFEALKVEVKKLRRELGDAQIEAKNWKTACLAYREETTSK